MLFQTKESRKHPSSKESLIYSRTVEIISVVIFTWENTFKPYVSENACALKFHEIIELSFVTYCYLHVLDHWLKPTPLNVTLLVCKLLDITFCSLASGHYQNISDFYPDKLNEIFNNWAFQLYFVVTKTEK